MKGYLFIMAIVLLALPMFAAEANANTKKNISDIDLSNISGLIVDCSSNESANVGSLPGDLTYGFKRFFENVDTFFTFDKSQSAIKHAKYGKLRALEAHLMACKAQEQIAAGKNKEANETMREMKKLVDDHDKEIEEAQTSIESAVESGTASAEALSTVENETRNSIIVLQRVYEKAPEAAKEGLLNALNNSINNYEKHQEKMQSKESEEKGKPDKNETVKGSDNETEDTNETEDDDNGKPELNKTTVKNNEGNEHKSSSKKNESDEE